MIRWFYCPSPPVNGQSCMPAARLAKLFWDLKPKPHYGSVRLFTSTGSFGNSRYIIAAYLDNRSLARFVVVPVVTPVFRNQFKKQCHDGSKPVNQIIVQTSNYAATIVEAWHGL